MSEVTASFKLTVEQISEIINESPTFKKLVLERLFSPTSFTQECPSIGATPGFSEKADKMSNRVEELYWFIKENYTDGTFTDAVKYVKDYVGRNNHLFQFHEVLLLTSTSGARDFVQKAVNN